MVRTVHPPFIVIWGVPGTGKSTFARWLVENKGFTYAETDRGAATAVQQVAARVEQGQPVVWEYGMYVQPDTIETLRRLREFGAEPWWFDGDRDAAFQAWRSENVKSNRPYPDQLWCNVVGTINANWHLVERFFGVDRILRTIEAGPFHVPPDTTYATIQRIHS
jgi:hypothetical protein